MAKKDSEQTDCQTAKQADGKQTDCLTDSQIGGAQKKNGWQTYRLMHTNGTYCDITVNVQALLDDFDNNRYSYCVPGNQ